MNKNLVAIACLVLVVIAVVLAFFQFYRIAWLIVGINLALLVTTIVRSGK